LYRDTLLAFCTADTTNELTIDFCSTYIPSGNAMVYSSEELIQIQHRWDLVLYNESAMQADLQVIRAKRKSHPIADKHTICYHANDIFIEEGAKIQAAILNAEKGPIYIGKNAIVEEQAVLKGPLVVSEGAEIKVGSYVYDNTNIGPYSKIGGEVSNSIIFEYSNKAHGGFMGHSVIGEWCNIGANATVSNLRNDYNPITLWDTVTQTFVNTGRQFCGLFLGAYSKCGINTAFNTGTVIGIGANLFGTGYMKRYLPAFIKGGPSNNFVVHELNDALMSIENTMKRRNQELTPVDVDILSQLYDYHCSQDLPIFI
jgi:UDP-N-acetylglucosamine diphosphorylase/glucosamine-1-phosphate N-acetyltransferase